MITTIFEPQTVRLLEETLVRTTKAIIVTHVSPDGDAVGSSLALYHYLRGRGINTTVIVPNAFPQFLKWLDGAEYIIQYDLEQTQAESLFLQADTIFCLDFNTLSRIKDVAPLVHNSSAQKIMIDHHPHPEPFAQLVFSFPHISSTSELVYRLIVDIGGLSSVSLSAAQAIYTGMMTDTGAFTYNANSPDIYLIISQLLSKGVDKDQIYRKVYNNYSEQRFRMMGYMLYEKMKIYKHQHTALLWLNAEEQKQFQHQKGDTEGFVNIPLSIKGVVFSIILREDTDMIKLSFRSVGKFPANEFAATYFGGGGHLNAAGGEYTGSLQDALSIIDNELPSFYQKYKHLAEEQLKEDEV